MNDRTQPGGPRAEAAHPEGPGVWSLLQDHVDHAMWQQDETGEAGQVLTRFWIVNPPETLTFDTFDEAEAMFETLGEGAGDAWAGDAWAGDGA